MPLYLPAPRAAGAAPADSGYLAWNYDMAPTAGTGSSPMATAGTLYVQRLYVDRPIVATNIAAHVQTAGATLTNGQNHAALYNAAGALLSTTGDQGTAWTSTGLKTMALAAAQSLVPGYYDVALWFQGTTGPAFVRGTSYAAVTGVQTGAALRSATANTGITTTAPATMGTKTASVQNYWVAIS